MPLHAPPLHLWERGLGGEGEGGGCPKKAVVLLSGGMDSAACLYWAKEQGWQVYALSVGYGQRHAVELQSAQRLAQALPVVQHLCLELNLRAMRGSALTDDIPVPVAGTPATDATATTIPVTYVPARNTILLSLALGWAESLGAHDLVIGVNAVDYSGYPDCRPEFVSTFERLANIATRAGVEGQPFRLHAPLLYCSKSEIVTMGLALGVDFSLTSSCYDPDMDGRACAACDACRLRLAGFRAAGYADPIRYRVAT
ncbi:MAG: 7-cyano-7-deazaguanine synthase QueC [Magnetococcales bacterium]|nr:7-cyano-7-deazaguanine synthase QueC [Magnetococcales bacterium]